MSTSYEQLRDGATGEGADAWRAADRQEGRLRALYNSLKEDPRYTNEHKSEKAWEAYEAARGKITENRAKAREYMEKRARSAGEVSLPFPPSEGLTTTDTNKLIASQNEASRVVRKLDRMEAGPKSPFKPDKLAVLRQEYGRGLQTGGVQGGAICRGVLAAADELGMDKESVVDGFRKPRHREALERAEHYAMLSSRVGGRVPEPPFARAGSVRRSDLHTGRGAPSFLRGLAEDRSGSRAS